MGTSAGSRRRTAVFRGSGPTSPTSCTPIWPEPVAASEAGAPRHAFHGRRHGKTLRAYQASLFETLLPRLAVPLGAPVDLAALFGQTPGRLELEIGFGGGEHLLAAAMRNPERAFIGAEPFVNGVAKVLAAVDAGGLANLRLHAGEVAPLLAALPAGCLGRVHLYYPDPWPKRRQRKRRLVAPTLLDALARAMRPGADLRYATDIDDYAGWTLVRVLAHPGFAWADAGDPAPAARWSAPWEGWTATRYESKAIREGRRPVYLTFVRC